MVFRGLSRDPFEVVMNIIPRLGGVLLSTIAAFTIAPFAFAQNNPGSDPQLGNKDVLALNMKAEAVKVFGDITPNRIIDIAGDTRQMSDDEVRKYLKNKGEENYTVVLETIAGMTQVAVEWIRKNPDAGFPYNGMPYATLASSDPKMREYVQSLGKDPAKLSIALNFAYAYGSNGGELYLSAMTAEHTRKGSLSIAAGTLSGLMNRWNTEGIKTFEQVITATEKDAQSLASQLADKPVEQVMKEWHARSKTDQFKSVLVSFWPSITAVVKRDNSPRPGG